MELYLGGTLPIFKIQKRAIRIMGCKSRAPCRNFFKKLEILPLKSQYIFPLLLFMVNDVDLFIAISENHNIHPRQSSSRPLPQANLTIYQQGVHFSGIKCFNTLPPEIIKITGNLNKLKQALKKFMNTQSFYTLEEFYSI